MTHPDPLPIEVPLDLAAYAIKVAEALKPVIAERTSHGEFYIARVTLEYDSEPCNVAIVADEYGGFCLEVRP